MGVTEELVPIDTRDILEKESRLTGAAVHRRLILKQW